MNIILFGPPGAGKGTQANKLVEQYKLHKFSSGDELRSEIQKKTPLGNKIQKIIDKGQLVPDNIINDLLAKILSNSSYSNRIIFDGYPRNLDQAKNLKILVENNKQKISFVFSLKVEKDLIIKRILGRETCTKCNLIFNEFFNPATKNNHPCGSNFLKKRADDNTETVMKRLETYLKITLPILDFYNKQNLLYEINGMAKIDQIFNEIRGIIGSYEA